MSETTTSLHRALDLERGGWGGREHTVRSPNAQQTDTTSVVSKRLRVLLTISF